MRLLLVGDRKELTVGRVDFYDAGENEKYFV